MYCKKCGNPLKDTDKFCDVCGEPTYTVAQPTGTAQNQGTPLTKKEFLDVYASPSIKKNIKVCSIIGYVIAGLNFLSMLVLTIFSLIDAAAILGLSLGMHIGKSRGCAIALLVYGSVSCLFGLISFGTPSGWAIVVIGICALVAFNKLNQEYQNYLASFQQNNF